MIKPETVRFVDMIEKLAVLFDGKKRVFGFYRNNAEVIKNAEADEDFCKKYLVYNDKKVELDVGDKNFYGIVKKVKNGKIKAYYEDVYVVKRGEEVLCLVGYPPEDEILPKNEDGDDVLFVIEKGRWYMV